MAEPTTLHPVFQSIVNAMLYPQGPAATDTGNTTTSDNNTGNTTTSDNTKTN